MPSLAAVTTALESIAPLRLAADWDAVGLLVSPRRPAIERIMTCLSLTEDVANEAVRRGADLVVSHHPLPFRPVARLTDESHVGRVLLALAGAGTGGGINDQLAAMLGLAHVAPLEPDAELPLVGFGRAGTAAAGTTVAALARRAAAALDVRHVHIVGAAGRPAGRVGIVCGSGGDCIPQVMRWACDTLLTGEIKLHQAIEAAAAGLAVVAVGHHASERFSMAVLAERLAAAVPGLECWASEVERDPLGWLELG